MENVIENNKLIAEFMGFEQKPLGYYDCVNHYEFVREIDGSARQVQYFKPEQMRFHSDWAWLMPAVEKIENIGPYIKIHDMSCRIAMIKSYNPTVYQFECEVNGQTKIEAVHSAVIHFITWYNLQTP